MYTNTTIIILYNYKNIYIRLGRCCANCRRANGAKYNPAHYGGDGSEGKKTRLSYICMCIIYVITIHNIVL